MQLENYNKFIQEQKEYFEKHLYKEGDQLWDCDHWIKTGVGSSWLLSRIKSTSLNFSIITKTKGIPNSEIDKGYQDFCKAMLVYSFRLANSKASVQKLSTELLMLKRWYHSLKTINNSTNPMDLSTEILNDAYDKLKEVTDPSNIPNHVGSFKRMQKVVNDFGFTKQKLEFDTKVTYLSKENRTKQAVKNKEILNSLNIDENDLETEKLISIQTFINIATLKNLCKSDGERILVNFLFLSIVTGFRSTETIMLKKDCLIERPVLDQVSKEQIVVDGKPQTILGIKYFGAKGSGIRIHWVEPSSANLVRSIIQNVLDITAPYRERLQYLKSKNLKDFLPKEIDDIKADKIEIDDFLEHLLSFKDENLSRSAKRRCIYDAFKNAEIQPVHELKYGSGKLKYYNKEDINNFIKSLADYDKNDLLIQKFNYEGKILDIPYEDLLFIHEYRSGNLVFNIINKTNIVPVRYDVINNFLGARQTMSVFQKYDLKEDDENYSKLTSHIPRHNINTFLAIADVADHLQAILMGRVDIQQNEYYQHLTLKQKAQKTSLISNSEKYEIAKTNVAEQLKPNDVIDPIDAALNFGLMLFNSKNDLETNLKNNFHTFDDKSEVSDFIEHTLNDGYFDDIAKAFNELSTTNSAQAKQLIDTHSYLHPLPFGSCMRDISAHGCPKRLACQSGESCVNFTLTGRLGELENLINAKKRLIEQTSQIDLTSVFGQKLTQQIENLAKHEQKLIKSLEKKIPISIIHTDDTELAQAKSLAQLFAYEHEKLESKNKEEQNA